MERLSITLTCAVITFSIAAPCYALRGVTVITGLTTPIAFVPHPTEANVQFVAQQDGVIWIIRDGVRLPTPFLNLASSISSGGERGLLGLAFPPDFATSRRFYVNFTNTLGHTVVARFQRFSQDPNRADPSTRKDMVWSTGLPYVERHAANHNGGCIAFGPDGFLYIGLGDSGGSGDPGHAAQDPNELRGKILRIDVSVADSHPNGFAIPPDNPFVDGVPIAARGEIWSFGLRNPWKFSFDNPTLGGTGAILIADVGQNAREEVSFEPPALGGRNYGWRLFEGTAPFNPSLPAAYGPLIPPIHDYSHTEGRSISGGYVYRGTRNLSARGRYFFADFITGRVWSFVLVVNPTTGEASIQALLEHTAELGGFGVLGNISGFGEDVAGELYVINYSAGAIVRIDPTLTTPTSLRVIR